MRHRVDDRCLVDSGASVIGAAHGSKKLIFGRNVILTVPYRRYVFLEFRAFPKSTNSLCADSWLRSEADIQTESLPLKFNDRNRRAGPLSVRSLPALFAPPQMAVAAAVKEINGEADREPNDKPQPRIARQAEH